jgi:hypothetical protein
MNDLYIENNYDTTLNLFNKRFLYRKKLFELEANNIIDFTDGEKLFYGRMNIQEIAIAVKSQSSLKNLKSSGSPTSPKKAIDFVANVFELLQNEILKASKNGKIYSNDKYLSDLKVYRAYESPNLKYDQYKTIFNKTLGNSLKTSNVFYRDMKEFLPILMNNIEKSLPESPLTYPGFIKSRLCDIMVSGLAIEIADLKYSDDNKKINQLINSPNWEFFVNACDTYGFMIDVDCPWRIVADLNSEIMIKAAQDVSPDNAGGYATFGVYYEPAFKETLRELHDLVADLYAAGRRKNFLIEEPCKNGVIKKTVFSKSYQFYEILLELDNEFMLKFYMMLRFFESGMNISKQEATKLINDTFKAHSSKLSRNAYISIFESIISKTFDKIGSMDYYRKAFREMNKQRFAREEISGIVLDTYGETSGGGY